MSVLQCLACRLSSANIKKVAEYRSLFKLASLGGVRWSSSDAPVIGNKYFPVQGYHPTDYVSPNMDSYRRTASKDPNRPTMDTEGLRKLYPSVMYGLFVGINVLYAKQAIKTVVEYKNIPVDVIAAGTTEIKLADVPEGQTKLFSWRGSPIFVRHRTADEISKEGAVDHTKLRDPQTDGERCKKPEFLIVIGVCTHLGCIPIANKGNWNGWYCPCHGSHYDAAGRIRKGPAPLNLEIPPYEFLDEDTIVVGAGA